MNKPTDSGERVIALGGKQRRLRLDFDALCKAEDALGGRNMVDLETWRKLNAHEYRALTWACLVHEDPQLTVEQVGPMMIGKDGAEATKALWDLYLGEYAKVDDDAAAKDRPIETDGSSDGQQPASTSVSASASSGG